MTAIEAEPVGPAQPGPPAPPRRALLSLAKIAAVPLGLALIVLIGANSASTGYLLPLSAVAGLGALIVLTRMAMYRFLWFVWTVLLIRPLLDLSKPNASAAAQPASQLATVIGAFVIVAGTVWFAAVSRRGDRLPMGVISTALVLMTATSLVSVAVADVPVASFAQVARTTGAVVIFVVLEQLIRTRRVALQTLLVCGLAAAIPVLVGLAQIPFLDTSYTTAASRISGTFLHPNTFGFFLVMLILMLYPLRGHVPPRLRRWFWVVMVVALAELMLTASRGGWMVLVVGLGVIAVLVKRERKLFWMGPAAVALVLVAFPFLFERLADLGAEDTLGGRPGNSATWRLDHYASLLEGTDISLFGIGPRMTEFLTLGGKPPHNDYLRLLLENGVVGLLCYLMFILGLVLVARHSLRHLRTGFDRSLAVGFTAVVVAFICNSFGSNVITQFVLLIYLLALAAVVQALAQLAAGTPAAAGTGAQAVSASMLDGTPSQQAQNGTAEGSIHGNP